MRVGRDVDCETASGRFQVSPVAVPIPARGIQERMQRHFNLDAPFTRASESPQAIPAASIHICVRVRRNSAWFRMGNRDSGGGDQCEQEI